MNRKLYILLVLTLVVFHFPSISAKSTKVDFSTLDHEITFTVTEDSYGYVWVGTSKGLYKYDGNVLVKYSRDDTPNSIINSMIYRILTDEEGNVYACSHNGYSKYDRTRDVFDNVYSTVQIFRIRGMLTDGNFIISTASDQLSIISPQLDSVIHSVRIAPMIQTDSFIDMGNGNYCIYSQTMLTILNKELEIIANTDVGSWINCVSVVEGRILVGTPTGVKTFSLQGQQVSDNPAIEQLSSGSYVNLITEDSSGSILIGIADKGLYRYSFDTDRTEFVRSFEKQDGDSRSFRFLFIDKGDRLWINRPTEEYNIGCLILETASKFPEFIELASPSKLNNLDMPVYSIDTDADNRLYALTKEGVSGYDKESGMFERIQLGIADTDYRDFSIDSHNRLWLITSSHIYVYHIEQQRLRLLKQAEIRLGSIHHSKTLELAGDYTVFTYSGGIVAFDRDLELMLFPFEESISAYMPPVAQQSGEYMILRLNYGNSVYFHPDQGFWNVSAGQEFGRTIMSIMVDSRGNRWYSTSEKGVIMEAANSALMVLDVGEGLPDNTVYETKEDNRGNIWITTTNGLAKYDPVKNNVINYQEVDGKLYDLQYGRIKKSNNGEIYVFGRDCIMRVNTELNFQESVPPVPLVSDVIINSDETIGDPGDLSLNHRQKHLTFNFSSLDFIRPDVIEYEYMMEGYDNTWNNVGNHTAAIYTNLPPGRYNFLLRARYQGSDTYTSDAILPINIHPAFWQTRVFQILIALVVLGLTAYLIVLFTRIRISRAQYRFKAENEEMKVNLFSNLSHTVRTPISLIVAPFRELTDRHEWDERDKLLIGTIDKNLERIMQLTRQLIDYDDDESDILDNPDYKLEVSDKDIIRTIREIAVVFRPTAIKNGLSISLDTPESLVLPIDEDKVVKIFYNLINNAVKFTPKGGNIKISAVPGEGCLYLSVADTGVGVPDNIKPRIFDKYFKAQEARQPAASRSFGVGLAHTKQLVQLHKGEITVSDNKPTGTVFTFTLPLSPDSYGESEIVAEGGLAMEMYDPEEFDQTQAADSKNVRLLIVEDNEEMLNYLRHSLAREYTIVTAKDGIEAIDMFGNDTIDIVITDVMMPRMDGYNLCRWIKENPEYCHIPVVILTAKSSKAEELEGIGCGADAYITKPFESKFLEAILDNLLDNRKKVQLALRQEVRPEDKDSGNLSDVRLNALDKRFMEKLYKKLDEHVNDVNFSIAEIYRELGFSRTSFYKKIRALTGTTPNDFIAAYRFSKVLELMKTGNYTLTEIADMTGFSSLSVFSRKFRSVYGATPTEYMKDIVSLDD